MKITSYLNGQWQSGNGETVQLISAVDDSPIGEVSSHTEGFADALHYSRTIAGPKLRQLTIHQRAEQIKALAKYLLDQKASFYQLSSLTGTTTKDAWSDIEGGIATMFSYSGIARRELNNESFIVEGDVEPLSKQGSFVGRHILTPKEGVSVHINAFNFPVWGMLEKITPSLIAGVPVIVKPATVTCYLTQAVVKAIIAANILPPGAIQLITGGIGDLFDHLTEQDIVTFTGSASTGQKLKSHPNIIAKSIPFTMEADSLNCAILAPDVRVEDPEFDLYIKEISREMTAKAGQKCTAIRRIIAPQHMTEAVANALSNQLSKTIIGDPTNKNVRMGPLVGKAQRQHVNLAVERLSQGNDIILSGMENFQQVGMNTDSGAFFAPTLLHCARPLENQTVHQCEAFGPVSTLMPYADIEEALVLAKLGKGSLAGSIFTYNSDYAKKLILGSASHHGRMLVIDRDCAKESTGHGTPLPNLVHGGPGRAGGGEELGGVRAIKHYMQRTAIQGSPNSLMAITNEYTKGANTTEDALHPFKKYFEQLHIGDSLTTHRRTVTEADIVNFGCLSGDHFYAHFDEIAAKDSMFGQRVAHGYFVISAAAGMFVDPAPGPILANYGLENLRFVEPVKIGDTIQVKITVKKKIKKDKRPEEERATGVVVWDVEVTNQEQVIVALYDIMTLVERQEA